MGTDLATPPRAEDSTRIGDREVQQLERDIDTFNSCLPALQEFILPGGVRSAALLHVTRTVCRRAERRVVTLAIARAKDGQRNVAAVRYLNRLGDLLFVLPRVLNARAQVPDETWCKDT